VADPGERLSVLAVELAAMAQTGLAFATDGYDLARYRRLREIAADVMAVLADADPQQITADLALDDGYATPHVDVRGALFVDGEILLVREASDGLWTLPGGWADPLDTPRASVEREFAEEAGLTVRATRLAAVWDGMVSNAHPYPFHIWKLFYLCERVDPAALPEAGLDGETTDVGFFSLDSLPPLSTRRTTADQLRSLGRLAADPSLPPVSD
jgi:ADP-ribose pyrophosphatase YjhB (NUDIX family)